MISAAEAGRGDERQGRSLIRVCGCKGQRRRSAHGVADQVSLLDVLGVHEGDHRRGEDVKRAVADGFGGAAVAGEIDRVGGVVFGQRFLVEHPVVEIAAEAVDEDDGSAAGIAHFEIADARAAGIDGLGLGAGVAGGRVPVEIVDEVLGKSVDIGIADRRRSDHAK